MPHIVGGGGAAGITSIAGLTGPVVTGAQLNAAQPVATTSLSGLESAADKATVDSLTTRWESVQSTFLKSKVPGLTEFQFRNLTFAYAPPNVVSVLTPHDGAIEGGGFSPTTAENQAVLSTSPFQTPKTGKWGMVLRARVGAPVNGTAQQIGLINGTVTHTILVIGNYATDTTHWAISVGGVIGVSTTVIDGAIHDIALTGDGTTVTMWLDGVSVVTSPQSNVSADEPMFPWIYNSTFKQIVATKFLIGYIAP